jgi:c-di-GMP-binding flagellar brake protein YcgR
MSDNFLNTFNVGDTLYIEVLVDHEPVKIKSEVLELLNENKVIISCPSYHGQLMTITQGQRFHMAYIHPESGVFAFNGLVVSRDKLDAHVRLHILRVSDFTKSQRREFFRLTIVEEVTLRLKVGEAEEELYHNGQIIKEIVSIYDDLLCFSRDISAGGMRLTSKKPIPVGTQVRVMFKLDYEKYDILGEIVRSIISEDVVERCDLGIKFINMESFVQSKLVSVIFNRQRKMLKKGMV